MDQNKLFVIPDDTPGGAEYYLKNIINFFLNDDNSYVYIISLKKKNTGYFEDLKDNNKVKLIYFNSTNTFKGLFFLFFHLVKFRKISFEHVFSSQVIINGFLGLLKRCNILNTKKLVCRESTAVFSRNFNTIRFYTYMFFYYIGYQSIDLLICQTKIMYQELIEHFPWLSDKINIKVIHNPIDLKNIETNFDSSSELNYNYIVTAGRLIPEKGFNVLINSFAKISPKFPNLKLIILGKGELKQELTNQIASLNINEKVLLPGFVKNVYPYFKNADLCVISSTVEGFPNVLLQMMSQNNNVISTLCSGGIDEIRGIKTIPINDSDKLSEAIIEVLLKDNSENRKYFDMELNNRTITSFVSKIENELISF